MGSRLVYGMAKQGLLPQKLSRVHPTRRTPDASIAVLTVIVLILVCSGDISSLAKATSVLLLAVFTIVNASLLVLQRRAAEPRGGFEVPMLVPLTGILVNIALLFGAGLRELSIAGAIIALVIGLYAVMRPRGEIAKLDADKPLEP